jgi:hypothetical protein
MCAQQGYCCKNGGQTHVRASHEALLSGVVHVPCPFARTEGSSQRPMARQQRATAAAAAALQTDLRPMLPTLQVSHRSLAAPATLGAFRALAREVARGALMEGRGWFFTSWGKQAPAISHTCPGCIMSMKAKKAASAGFATQKGVCQQVCCSSLAC